MLSRVSIASGEKLLAGRWLDLWWTDVRFARSIRPLDGSIGGPPWRGPAASRHVCQPRRKRSRRSEVATPLPPWRWDQRKRYPGGSVSGLV